MKKALVVATVIGFIAGFEKNDISILKEMGYEVHVAADLSICNNKSSYNALVSLGVITHNIKFSRNPFRLINIKALQKLDRLVKSEQFDLIHCHTPVGGVLGRIVGHFNHVNQVLYSAHGFHFFSGAPLKNWLLFYPIEKFCSRWTDILITLNDEDYQRALKFRSKTVKRIHGVGIDINKFNKGKKCRENKRNELGVSEQDIVLLSVGELSRDKNHKIVLEAMKELSQFRCKYFICGKGNLEEKLTHYILENNLEGNIQLLGYRTDISELLQATDIYVFPSLFEGLSVALMEAVAAKIPIACTNVRGNVDTVITRESYFSPHSAKELVRVVKDLISKDNTKMVNKNYENLLKFQLSEVDKEMRDIYKLVDKAIEKRKHA